MLSEILARAPATSAFPNLLVGTESCDDAAVYRLNETQALVATTDFFMPIVDDPYEFGRIAAANAISDVYAMGARPFMALAILGVPVGKLPAEMVLRITEGGQAVCQAAGIPSSASAMKGFPPIAYTSEMALVAAMRPNSNGSSTIGMKKSVVATSACVSFRR